MDPETITINVWKLLFTDVCFILTGYLLCLWVHKLWSGKE